MEDGATVQDPRRPIRIKFKDSGHILGSAMVEFLIKENLEINFVTFSFNSVSFTGFSSMSWTGIHSSSMSSGEKSMGSCWLIPVSRIIGSFAISGVCLIFRARSKSGRSSGPTKGLSAASGLAAASVDVAACAGDYVGGGDIQHNPA